MTEMRVKKCTPGLKITAGQRTMSGQNDDLSRQNFDSAVILTGHLSPTYLGRSKKTLLAG